MGQRKYTYMQKRRNFRFRDDTSTSYQGHLRLVLRRVYMHLRVTLGPCSLNLKAVENNYICQRQQHQKG